MADAERLQGPIDGVHFPVPLDLMRARVEYEIQDHIAGGGRDKRHYLYNFQNWLMYKADGPRCGANVRYLLTMAGEDYYRKHSEIEPESSRPYFSERYLSVSHAEFVGDIDKAMAAEGVYTDVAMLMWEHEVGEHFQEARERFADYMLPVYIRLRALGYTHQEIAA